MVVQVRMFEKFTDNLSPVIRTRRVFAYGSHPQALVDEVKSVSSADATGNTIRVIMDELLVGNELEEVQCRALVDEDNLSRVPRGVNPEDMARCALPNDALRSACPAGPRAVCICDKPEGCARSTTDLVAEGDPVGIRDDDLDGAADRSSLIDGAVSIVCGTITVPLNLDTSYYNPSGTQDRPAMGGFDALGPAIVLAPPVLPTNLECGLVFASSVVDKGGEGVCVGQYANFDPTDPLSVRDLAPTCNPGDFSAFRFSVEALSYELVGETMGVARTSPIVIQANAPVAMTTINNITITPAVPFDIFLDGPSMGLAIIINPTDPTGFAASTTYTITIPTTVTDTFGQPAAAPTVLTFTTSP